MAWSVHGADAAWQQRVHKEERAARRTPAYVQQVEDRPASSPLGLGGGGQGRELCAIRLTTSGPRCCSSSTFQKK